MEQLASAWVARLSVHSLVTVVDLTHATLLHQANYALSGTFHPLSKLIICVVMLRGRHRGLPVALDRAIMLPRELDPESEDLDSVDDEESAYPRFTFPTPIFPPSSFPFTSSFPAPIPEAEDEGSTSTSTTPTSTPSSEKKGMDLEAQ